MVPMVMASVSDTTATIRLMRSPYMMADSMSRPCGSVPSQKVWPVAMLTSPGGRPPSMMLSCIRS